MNRRDRGGAWQRHAERFRDAGHRRRRPHDGAGTGRHREVAFDDADLGVIDVAGPVARPKSAAIGAGAEPLALMTPGHHRAADQLDGRHIGRNRSHQLRGHGLVAAAHQHDGIHRLRPDHLLGVHRHEIAEAQARRVEEHFAEGNRSGIPTAGRRPR